MKPRDSFCQHRSAVLNRHSSKYLATSLRFRERWHHAYMWSTSLRHQPKCKQLFLFSGDNVNCQPITWNCCKQWKFHWNNALNVPGLWLVYCILKDKQPGWMCTKAAGSENIVWSEWLRHTRCCRVPERVIEDLFVRNRSSLHSAWQKHRVQTQSDETRPRQKIRGASKVVVSQEFADLSLWCDVSNLVSLYFGAICNELENLWVFSFWNERPVSDSTSSVRHYVKDVKIYICFQTHVKPDDILNLVASLAVARRARKTRSAGFHHMAAALEPTLSPPQWHILLTYDTNTSCDAFMIHKQLLHWEHFAGKESI